jgi:hypothetical protein
LAISSLPAWLVNNTVDSMRDPFFERGDRDLHRQIRDRYRFVPADSDLPDDATNRLDQDFEAILARRDLGQKQWQRLWQNVTAGGSPWAAGDQSEIVRWKRDRTFCVFYCPCKLKRNRHFDPHLKASLAREIGNFHTAEEVVEQNRKVMAESLRLNPLPTLLKSPSDFDQPVQKPPVDPGRKNRTETGANVSHGRLAFELPCDLIQPTQERSAVFQAYSDAFKIVIDGRRKTYFVRLVDVRQILQRRRAHIQTAIEIFCANGRAFFLNFPNESAPEIIRRIRKLEFASDTRIQTQRDFSIYFQTLGFTERWAQGEMSTFEYLMRLNIFSGRTFNDLSQYPFFPWVIRDYTSENLDLTSPATFRDLSRPIGALGKHRFQELQQRRKEMAVFEQQSYLYSSYVICPLSICLWLIRQEPFTTLHIQLQSGRFDHANRIFASIADSWHFATHHFNNYRELLPEFYFTAGFLCNENGFDLGTNRKERVNDVALPPWSHNSPHEFVYLMRKALECEFVSQRIHHWIDLVWGYQQSGPEAEKADNVYQWDFYESAYKTEAGSTAARRAEIQATMCHVGQVPPQLFHAPHPARERRRPRSLLSRAIHQVIATGELQAAFVYSLSDVSVRVVFSRGKWIGRVDVNLEEGGRVLMDLPQENFREQIAAISAPSLFVTETGKVVGRDDRVESLSSIGERVTHLVSDREFSAFVVDQSTLRILGPDLFLTVPFYGEGILCSAISLSFKIIACGTSSGHVIITSLLGGRNVNVVDVGDVRTERILISSLWGFIIVYGVSQAGKKCVLVHDVNGRLIRQVAVNFAVQSWTCYGSRDGFDYLVIASEDGKVYHTEAFYFAIGTPVLRTQEQLMTVAHHADSNVSFVVTRTGRLHCLPIV